MQPTEQDDDNSIGPADVSAPPAPAPGRGDFSLKPAGRRKDLNKKLFILIGGAVIGLIVICVGFGAVVINSMDNAEPVVDESKVKAAPILENGNKKDESMAAQMDKLLGDQQKNSLADQEAERARLAAAEAAAGEQQKANSTAQARAGEPERTEQTYGQQQQQQQQEETLFTPISRFESSGMSNGSGGGGGNSYGGSQAGYAGSSDGADERQEKLRQFVNADPNELARNVINGQDGSAGAGGLTGTGGGSLLDNLNGSQYMPAKARLAPNPKFLLPMRKTFQCGLDTGIKTDFPGFVECHLLWPLYSADGSVILARAGAKLYGEQRVEVKAGQTSVFTTWTELETTNGVRASLNGLGTDAMGRSGTDARIDNHWGGRIGGAVMLSTFKDVLNGGMNAASKNSNSQFTFNNTESSTEDLASKILDSTIGILPTGYINPGTVINVVVAQDIDFSTVLTTRR